MTEAGRNLERRPRRTPSRGLLAAVWASPGVCLMHDLEEWLVLRSPAGFPRRPNNSPSSSATGSRVRIPTRRPSFFSSASPWRRAGVRPPAPRQCHGAVLRHRRRGTSLERAPSPPPGWMGAWPRHGVDRGRARRRLDPGSHVRRWLAEAGSAGRRRPGGRAPSLRGHCLPAGRGAPDDCAEVRPRCPAMASQMLSSASSRCSRSSAGEAAAVTWPRSTTVTGIPP